MTVPAPEAQHPCNLLHGADSVPQSAEAKKRHVAKTTNVQHQT